MCVIKNMFHENAFFVKLVSILYFFVTPFCIYPLKMVLLNIITVLLSNSMLCVLLLTFLLYITYFFLLNVLVTETFFVDGLFLVRPSYLIDVSLWTCE